MQWMTKNKKLWYPCLFFCGIYPENTFFSFLIKLFHFFTLLYWCWLNSNHQNAVYCFQSCSTAIVALLLQNWMLFKSIVHWQTRTAIHQHQPTLKISRLNIILLLFSTVSGIYSAYVRYASPYTSHIPFAELF